MKTSNLAWWQKPELLTKRRIQYAYFDMLVTLPDEHGRTLLLEAQSGLRANFGTGHVLRFSTGLGLSEAVAIAKPLITTFALSIPCLPRGTYYASYKAGAWTICKGRGKRARVVAL